MDDGERLTQRLAALHDSYRWAVNAAVSRGAPDEALVELSDEYADAALRVLSEPLAADP